MAGALIEQVDPGMAVVDAAGELVGTVRCARVGDPGAAHQPATTRARPWLQVLAGCVLEQCGEPRVPEPLRSQFLASGFIEVDAAELPHADLYLASGAIASVTESTVRLKLRKERFIAEGQADRSSGSGARVPSGALWWVTRHSWNDAGADLAHARP
jgi:hypothetical protein